MQQLVYPKITFIIPTLNASFFLSKCLQAIRSQHYPQNKIEIIVADGGSSDDTLYIAKKYKAKIISNPEILHEQGKSRASKIAKGDIIFYTDADNILATNNWLTYMIKPYIKEKKVVGFLPQTVPAPDSNSLDRYLGYLFTDPFTWFVYGWSSNPQTYKFTYKPIKTTKDYELYIFNRNYPLFGLSQGVGTRKEFKRIDIAYADDLLAGIKLMREGGIIAYVPQAEVYHYHVSGFSNFIKKYRWRIRNNIVQKIKGMGITNRTIYFSTHRKIKILLFIPYSYSLIFPFIDSVLLSIRHRDPVMMYHLPATLILSTLIVVESIKTFFQKKIILGTYE